MNDIPSHDVYLSVKLKGPTIWMIVGQGPIALAVGAVGGCLDIFTLLYSFSPLSPSLWETVGVVGWCDGAG